MFFHRRNPRLRYLLCVIAIVWAASGRSAETKPSAPLPAQIMSFRQWKTQQIVDAQNQVARVANKSLLLRTTDSTKVVIAADGDNLDELEKQLKQARIRLDVAQDLSFDDYVTIYLGQFAKDRNSLVGLATKLSPQDVAEMLEFLSSRSASPPNLGGTPSEPVVTGAPAPAGNGSNL